MGWDHQHTKESRLAFQLRFLGIDADQVLRNACNAVMRDSGIESFQFHEEELEDVGFHPGECGVVTHAIIRWQTDHTEHWVHKLVRQTRYDDQGFDAYEFYPEEEVPMVKTRYPEEEDS